MWLGVIAVFVAASAVLIGAIAGRQAEVIDVWTLAVGGVAVLIGAGASAAILASRQQSDPVETTSADIIVHSLPHASTIIDSTGRARSANDKFQQLFPDSLHAPFTALKRRLGDGATAPGSILNRLITAVASGDAASDDVPTVGEGAGIEWLRISATPLADQSGSALWTFEDITDRRRAEAAAREAWENLSEFVETAPVGFYSVDEEGRFLLINGALASWLGYAPGEIEAQGLRLHDIVTAPSAHTPAYRVAGAEDAEPQGDGQEVQLRCQGGDLLPAVVVQSENRGEDAAGPDHRGLRGGRRSYQPAQPVLGDSAARDHGTACEGHVRLRDHDDALADPVPGDRVLRAAVLSQPPPASETNRSPSWRPVIWFDCSTTS